ncbi:MULTISPECIES: hypothetical protein [unclassified Phyllobacterium]|uniref:hypothetical protein n=1 Tax=Phyllobacterium TaxID=28100 RepID=UPI00088B9D3F|nr:MULTISPECIES: hypothetical protein [unclassified Phyllobacterium]MBA8901916.1 hypothetical protein [Phyllobacterium sp. P30BS-XVII]UGX88727.1 hypothetical protein LLE53_022080 [Phyllobacterium sp. T1293]SDP52356.1 hypothetical protein SAMN05443582_105279 [Phyllobacterium sp. OV277]
MPQTYADLTLAEALSDPLINAVMSADHVTRSELELLMKSVARKNFEATASTNWQRPFTVDGPAVTKSLAAIGNRMASACCGSAV